MNITHPVYPYVLLLPLYFGVAVVCSLLQAELVGLLYILVLGVTRGIYFFVYRLPLLSIKGNRAN